MYQLPDCLRRVSLRSVQPLDVHGELHFCVVWTFGNQISFLFLTFLQRLLFSTDCSQSNPFIVFSVDSVELVASKPSDIATSVACAFRSVSLTLTSAFGTNTRTIVQSAGKICFLRDNLRRIYHVDMPFMRIVFESWQDLTIDVPSAKRPWLVNKAWRLLGKPGPVILPSIPCLPTYNVWSISCATIVNM